MTVVVRTTFTMPFRLGMGLAILIGIGTPAVKAQSAFWNTTSASGGSWGNSANWQGGTVASGSGNTAGFFLDFTPGASVTLDANRTIGTIISSSATPWSIDPGTGGTLTTATFLISGNGPLTVTAPLVGVDLNKENAGTLILSSPASNYSGPINVNEGTLKLTGSANYSPGPNVVSVAFGATLDVSGLTSGGRYGGDPSTRLGLNAGDVLTGGGTVNGGIKVASGATVSPSDNGVGPLIVTGSADFAGGSTWQVKLGTANAGGASNNNNRLDLSGGLKLQDGVTLAIDGGGLTFTAGQTYTYRIATSGAGSFNIGSVTFQPTNFAPGDFVTPASFTLTPSGTDLLLSVTPVPVPEPASVLATSVAGAAGFGLLRRRPRHRVPTGR